MEKKGSFVDQITAVLVQQGTLAKKEVPAIHRNFAQAAQAQFDDFLLDEGLVEPEDLLKALSALYQVPFYDVTDYFFQRHLLRMFPKDFLLRNAIIPLERDENMLVVIASEPEKEGLENVIGQYVSYDINFFVGIRRDICDAVKEYYDKALTQVEEDQDSREERLERFKEAGIEESEQEDEDNEEDISQKDRDEAW